MNLKQKKKEKKIIEALGILQYMWSEISKQDTIKLTKKKLSMKVLGKIGISVVLRQHMLLDLL